MYRAGQNHICTVYIWYFWQGNHQIYGHVWYIVRCIYTVLANPSYVCTRLHHTHPKLPWGLPDSNMPRGPTASFRLWSAQVSQADGHLVNINMHWLTEIDHLPDPNKPWGPTTFWRLWPAQVCRQTLSWLTEVSKFYATVCCRLCHYIKA